MSSPNMGVGTVHSSRPVGAKDLAKAARHTPQPKQQPVQPKLHEPKRKTGGA